MLVMNALKSSWSAKLFLLVAFVATLTAVGADKDVTLSTLVPKEATRPRFFTERRFRDLIAGHVPFVRKQFRGIPMFSDISPFDEIVVDESRRPWYLDTKVNKPVTVKFGGQSFVANFKDTKLD